MMRVSLSYIFAVNLLALVFIRSYYFVESFKVFGKITLKSYFQNHSGATIRDSHQRAISSLSDGSDHISFSNSHSTFHTSQYSLSFPRKDNFLERMLIFLLSFVLRNLLSVKHINKSIETKIPRIHYGMTFDDFVAVSKAIFRSSSSTGEVKDRIVNLLRTVIPNFLRMIFRTAYKLNAKWICELSSQCMSFGTFDWLVGPTDRFPVHSHERLGNVKYNAVSPFRNMNSTHEFKIQCNKDTLDTINFDTNSKDVFMNEIQPGDLAVFSTAEYRDLLQFYQQQPQLNGQKDDSNEPWQSGVKLLECRYLAQSGCKALCLHLCKAPTQEFFLKELGMPLYMKPDFSNNSCEMRFGVLPPNEEDDPAFKETCFATCFNNFADKATKSHKKKPNPKQRKTNPQS